MDGVILDSEPLWQEAEIIAFARVGVNLTHKMCTETMGMRVDEVVKQRFKEFKWTGATVEEVQEDILTELEKLILAKSEPMAGVERTISFFQKKGLRLALASSTHLRLIKTVLNKFNMLDTFEVVRSAEFEQYGKPHPAIYITTLEKLGLKHDEAFAIEDSFNGILAAKAARLKTVAIPEKSVWHETRYDIAELKLKSLEELGEKEFDILKSTS